MRQVILQLMPYLKVMENGKLMANMRCALKRFIFSLMTALTLKAMNLFAKNINMKSSFSRNLILLSYSWIIYNLWLFIMAPVFISEIGAIRYVVFMFGILSSYYVFLRFLAISAYFLQNMQFFHYSSFLPVPSPSFSGGGSKQL